MGLDKMLDPKSLQYGPLLRGDIIKRNIREDPKVSIKGPMENKRSFDGEAEMNAVEETHVLITTMGVGEEPKLGLWNNRNAFKHEGKCKPIKSIARDC